ncbi:MAG: DUF6807 family protein [Kiritimatiellia bacterium]
MRFPVLRLLSLLAAAAATAPSGVAAEPAMRVINGAQTGDFVIRENATPVLVYHHQAVQPPPGKLEKIAAGNRKYAQPRGDYIHPLYGPSGEELTFDWAVDHPHHRGIYWAWPEVTWNGETRDLHALQGVFARPAGTPVLTAGDEAAGITAESNWMWGDKTPVVHEKVVLRAEKSGPHGRRIDLTVTLEALEDGVTIARRGTDKYGGLNTRLAPVKGLALSHQADPAAAATPMAWHRAAGTWGAATNAASITIFEKATNPGYPADHIQFPELPWFQPTFPKAGQRHALKKGEPLTLQYRYWIRGGEAADEKTTREEWRKFNEPKPGATP